MYQINPNNIPQPFRPLIPFAEKWGITDDGYLDNAIEKASLEGLRELVITVSEFDADGFDEWLGNPGTNNHTRDWTAFVCQIDACDLAKLRLQSEDVETGNE
jgi:hypothetical protein